MPASRTSPGPPRKWQRRRGRAGRWTRTRPSAPTRATRPRKYREARSRNGSNARGDRCCRPRSLRRCHRFRFSLRLVRRWKIGKLSKKISLKIRSEAPRLIAGRKIDADHLPVVPRKDVSAGFMTKNSLQGMAGCGDPASAKRHPLASGFRRSPVSRGRPRSPSGRRRTSCCFLRFGRVESPATSGGRFPPISRWRAPFRIQPLSRGRVPRLWP